MFILLAIASFMLVALTALPLSRHEAWWIRSLDFPRLQLASVALLLVAVELAVLPLERPGEWVVVLGALACFIYQAGWILPYTRLFPREVEPARPDARDTLRIMVANVLASNRRADDLLRQAEKHRPHILVTLESNAWWERQLDRLQPEYPHALKCPLENLYGMHVYSRLPLEDVAIEFIVEHDVPSMHAAVRLASDRRVQLHFLHPAPPAPGENASSRERDAELIVVGRRVAERREPSIVTGDLNDVAWSSTTRLFRRVSRLLDPRVGRGMFNTFHARWWWMRWPLDHLFHSDHFTLVQVRRLADFGSDHFPILVELALDESAAHRQEAPAAEPEDHARAEEKAAPARDADSA